MKKNWIYFIGGVVVGIILTIVTLYFIGTSIQQQLQQEEDDQKTTMFEVPGDVIDVKSFKVFQVVEEGKALVHGESESSSGLYIGAVYMLTNDEGKLYYDDEILKVSKGKEARQIGIFEYKAALGQKTVPIVRIMDK